jgi:DNA-binding Xre family transcriptional regulator
LQRSPTDQELQAAIQMALQQLTLLQQDPARVPEGQTVGGQLLTNLCQVLLCSNEFLYID